MYYRDRAKSKAMATIALLVSTTKQLAPLVSQALFVAGAQGLEERAGRGATLVTYDTRRARLVSLWKRTEQALRALLPAGQLPRAVFEVDDQESWKTAWTAQLRPIALTRRLLLAPATAELPEPGRGRRVLLYRPALAFGDGDHATTRLAARAIEAHYLAQPGGQLLDIGTGTGVLSLVALASGARRALGTDIDRAAVRAAIANAKLNGLAPRARFVQSPGRVSGAFDLVVVNIELRPLLEVLANLPAAARRAPRLLVTGFLSSQSAQVVSALKAAGFVARRRKSEQGWVVIDSRRAGIR
jgi:ribosomal protein L11 methyltransferase